MLQLDICAQHFMPSKTLEYKVIEDTPGGGIYYKCVSDSIKIVLQVMDLRMIKCDFLLGGIKDIGNGDGIYFKKNRINPQFYKLSPDSIFEFYSNTFGDGIISITNGAFFEAPKESISTSLAYPLKINGEIVSSGASPYGPHSGDYPLKILNISDSSASIMDYDVNTGFPLTSIKFINQIVALNYGHHPNAIEFKDSINEIKTRYHLITAVNFYGNSLKETLLILSCNGDMSIFDLADEMKKIDFRIKDDEILTLDGGSSISVKDGNGNNIIEPLNYVKVPMYIGFRNKNYESKIDVPK